MSEMIEISKLKEHPKNKEFFDDINGDRWEDFKQSVIRRGIVEPIVVTQDLLIVSGHQRVRACNEMQLLDIPCRITYYPDFDEKFNRTKEDMILEDLICTNIMQRGVGNVNPMKMAKCIMELERIYGIKQGKGGNTISNPNNSDWSQGDLANQLGINQDTITNYKKLTNLIPELQQMVENGSMKATVGYKIWAKMSQEEQEKFFEEIGREKLKTMTRKATEEYINKINEKERETEQLKQELEKERNKPKEKEYVETVVDNTDYSIVNKLNKIEQELKNKTIEADKLKTKLELMTDKAEAYKQDSEDYQKMKEDVTYLTKQKDDLGRQLQAITDISGLVVEVEHLIKEKLAPIRYSRSLLEAKDDEIVLRNLSDIVQTVQQWCDEIKEFIPNKINYVEVIE